MVVYEIYVYIIVIHTREMFIRSISIVAKRVEEQLESRNIT